MYITYNLKAKFYSVLFVSNSSPPGALAASAASSPDSHLKVLKVHNEDKEN